MATGAVKSTKTQTEPPLIDNTLGGDKLTDKGMRSDEFSDSPRVYIGLGISEGDKFIYKGIQSDKFPDSSYDNFGLEIAVTGGLQVAPTYDVLTYTDKEGGNFSYMSDIGGMVDLDLELRVPYGFGLKTELGLNGYTNQHEITDPDYIAKNQTLKDSKFIEVRDSSKYWVPTSVQWHTPVLRFGFEGINSNWAFPKFEDVGLSVDVGAGVAAQNKFSGSEIDENWKGEVTQSKSGSCYQGWGYSSECTRTTTVTQSTSRIVEGKRTSEWGAVPFINAGLNLHAGMDTQKSRAEDDNSFFLRLGYMRYFDSNAPTDPQFVTMSAGGIGYF